MHHIHIWILAALLLGMAAGSTQRCLLQTQNYQGAAPGRLSVAGSSIAETDPHGSKEFVSESIVFSDDSSQAFAEHSKPLEALAHEAQDPADSTVSTTDLKSTVKQMMEKINSAATENKSSVEVSAAANDMAKEFHSFVASKFKTSFGEAQKAIAKAVTSLGEDTKALTVKKQDADDATINLATCRRAEKASIKDYEDCRTEGLRLNITLWEACQVMSDTLYYDKKNYPAMVKACKAAKKAAVANEHTCLAKQSAFQSKRTECDNVENQRSVKVCEFGTSLQIKCDTYSSMNKLVESTQSGTGTSQSETDRMAQWEKAMSLKCLLKSYIGHGATNETVQSMCESDINYTRDIGVMDYMLEQVSANMQPSPPMFSCQEKQINFEGKLVNVGNTSAKYGESIYAPNVVLSPPGSKPFSFC